MVQIGKFNRLMVIERSAGNLYLESGRGGAQISIPIREAPAESQVGSMLDVFVYGDPGGSLVATTKRPLAVVGEFASLKVSSLQKVGAFLDWGLPKELFLPFREQTRELRIGDRAIVYLYLDNTQRISASMRLEKFLEKGGINYRDGASVHLLIFGATDLGYKAIINGKHLGILYKNEIFQPIELGQRIGGFIKYVREDGKIDLSLQQAGYRGVESIGEKILSVLEKNGGFLAVTDKSSTEKIYDLFGVSKKKYKMTVGTLYKSGVITLEEEGIRLRRPK